MKIDRRAFHTVLVGAATGIPLGCGLLPREPAFGQRLAGHWPSRVIQMHTVNQRGLPPVITAVRIHPEGTLLATAGDDHLVCLWDLQTDQLVRRLPGHTDWVHTLAFSPTGRFLASAGTDRRVVFWDVMTGEPQHVFHDPQHPVTKVAWSHDGALVAGTGFEGRLRIYDVESRSLRRELTCPCDDMRGVSFSPDDQMIAAGGRNGIVRLWRVADGQTLDEYQAHRLRIRELLFSPDGRQIVTCGEDRKIFVRSLADRQGFELPQRPAKVMSLAFFGPEGLAAGGSDNLIRLWNLASQTEIAEPLNDHRGSVVAMDSNGELLVSGSFDATIRIWTVNDRVARQPNESRPRRRS